MEATLTSNDEAPGQQEVERLREQVGELQSELATAQAEAQEAKTQHLPPPRARRRRGWRGPVATTLIVLGCVLAPVSVLGVWISNQVSNTDRYVANVSPLISEPAVQGALTNDLSTAVVGKLHVQAIATKAGRELSARGLSTLGGLLVSFSGSIAGGIDGFIHSTIAKVVASPQVQKLWVDGNRAAHTQLDKALSGQPGAISTSGGKVVIGLGPFIDRVKSRLAARGFTLAEKLPPINPTFPLFSATYLVRAQSAYRLLNTLKWVLPLLALILFAAGVYVARSHRRALIGAGLGLAVSMLVLGAGIAVARAIYLTKVPNSTLPADAAAVIFDTVVRFIKQGLRVIAVLGLVVAIGAFFTGPSATAVRTRSALMSAFGWLRGTGERAGLTTGPVGRWVYRYRKALWIAGIAVAALIFVFWTNPTGLVVLVIALVLLAYIGLVELIGRPPAAPVSPAAAAQRRLMRR